MEKHTFKPGDRVFGQVCTGDVKVPGVFVKMGGYHFHGCIIRRDDGVDGIEKGLYWFADCLTTHDTDFQVGDWVRYEQVIPETQYGEIDKEYINQPLTISGVRSDGGINILAHDEPFRINRVCEKENLVKIQSPQEVHVVIQEKESNNRRVHGVKECMIDGVKGWRKDEENRMLFYPSTHWEPLTEWVTIQVEKGGFDKLKMYENLYGYSDDAYHKHNEYTKWRYPQ